MIDEYWTFEFYGYHSDDWAGFSQKPIVVRCDECCQYRIIQKKDYRDLCYNCSIVGHSDIAKHKISVATKGKNNPFYGKNHSQESRKEMSASHQGILYEEWIGFSNRGGYCELFDDACRERIRAKYHHKCFICDLSQDKNINKNGKLIKLSVHHIDRNKNQGCDGVLWKLIPVCMHCHKGAHYDPVKSRLEYLLDDEDV